VASASASAPACGRSSGFLCLALTHSESLEDQHLCMDEWSRAMDELAPDDPLNAFHEIFHRHVAVIMRFGRFPHRNAILHRASTPAEADFLGNDAFRFDLPLVRPPEPGLRRHGEEACRQAPRPGVRDAAHRRQDRRVSMLFGMLDPTTFRPGTGVAETMTVRSVFVISPAKRVELALSYPAHVGRNFDEILRVVDALQLSARYRVATPASWKPGDDTVVLPFISDEEAERSFADTGGVRRVRSYLRYVRDPSLRLL